MRIVLIGFAGCYKSTVGRLLADKLDMPHIDTDLQIEKLFKRTVAQLLSESETSFRNLERMVVAELPKDRVVLSCGGGTLMCGNGELLKDNSVFVWLTATIDTIFERVANDKNRPLHFQKSKTQLQEMLEERKVNFERYSNFLVATDNKTPEQVAEEVVKALNIEYTESVLKQ